VGFQLQVTVWDEPLPDVGIEMHPAILFPFTRKVIFDAAATLMVIGVVAL
jgi:preprotein translocase subunit SecB